MLQPYGILPSSYRTALDIEDKHSDIEMFEKLLAKRFGLEVADVYQDEPLRDSFWERFWTVLRDISDRINRIVFLTREGHIGTLYHPQPLVAVRPGDVVVGLFGKNHPFVSRFLPRKANEGQTYTIVNIVHVVCH